MGSSEATTNERRVIGGSGSWLGCGDFGSRPVKWWKFASSRSCCQRASATRSSVTRRHPP
jgi:hypothetical protein